MKVLMICFNKINQGTYLRAFEFARGLIEFGHEVTLMATSEKWGSGFQEYEEKGIKILTTPDLSRGSLRSGWDPYNVIARLRWLKGRNYDIVHAFESRPTVIYPALNRQKKGVPMVMDWCDWLGYGGSVEQRPNPIVRAILRPVESYYENNFRTLADANIVICSTLFERALGLGVNRSNLAIIPNGFNLPDWKKYSMDVVRQAMGIPKDDFVVGCVGSLFPGDAQLMSKAFENIKKQLPKSRLFHIGRSNYTSSSNDSVYNFGPVDPERLCQLVSACDVCWLPFEDTNANRGRFPLKFTNYLAAGKPCVVTDVGDIADYVRNEGVGLTCPPTPADLAGSVLRLYVDLTLREQFAMEAEKLSQDSRYTWMARATELLSIYKRVI